MVRGPGTDHNSECYGIIPGLACGECECWCHLVPADREAAWETWARQQTLVHVLEERGLLNDPQLH